MRVVFAKELEQGRELIGPYASKPGDQHGRFVASPGKGPLARLLVLLSDGVAWAESGLPGPAWEHASVSVLGKQRCPSWEEMCWVKSLIWEPDEWVVQYHPARSSYVKCHPFCLHLWKPLGVELPTPPAAAVGPKQLVSVLS